MEIESIIEHFYRNINDNILAVFRVKLTGSEETILLTTFELLEASNGMEMIKSYLGLQGWDYNDGKN